MLLIEHNQIYLLYGLFIRGKPLYAGFLDGLSKIIKLTKKKVQTELHEDVKFPSGCHFSKETELNRKILKRKC